MVNYKNLRLNNITSPQYRHLLLLIFWPIYGLIFLLLERGLTLQYHDIYCAFDDLIPFNEWFVIPYYFWFVYIVGMLFYTGFFDIPSYRKYMWFIIFTYLATCAFYVIYPNAQQLRPVQFERDNILVTIVKNLYAFDTNTNVCPSLHVIGSVAVSYGAWNSKHFKTPLWRILFSVVTLIISFSTVFLKQHSIIDVIAGFAVCVVAIPLTELFCKKLYKNAYNWENAPTGAKAEDPGESIEDVPSARGKAPLPAGRATAAQSAARSSAKSADRKIAPLPSEAMQPALSGRKRETVKK